MDCRGTAAPVYRFLEEAKKSTNVTASTRRIQSWIDILYRDTHNDITRIGLPSYGLSANELFHLLDKVFFCEPLLENITSVFRNQAKVDFPLLHS